MFGATFEPSQVVFGASCEPSQLFGSTPYQPNDASAKTVPEVIEVFETIQEFPELPLLESVSHPAQRETRRIKLLEERVT